MNANSTSFDKTQIYITTVEFMETNAKPIFTFDTTNYGSQQKTTSLRGNL